MVNDEQPTQKLLTYGEAAKASGIEEHTIRGRVRTGSLPSYKWHSKTYVTMEDISEWQPKWHTDHDLYIREAHAEGIPDADMARHLGISRERVRQIRSGLGLKANPLKPRLPKTFQTDQPVAVWEV